MEEAKKESMSETRIKKPKVTNEHGSTYEGQWLGNKWEGEGIWTASNGDEYEGSFRGGKRNGLGK